VNGLPDRLKWIPMFLKALDEARSRVANPSATTRATASGTGSLLRNEYHPAPSNRTAASRRRGTGSGRAGKRPASQASPQGDGTKALLERLRRTEAALRELQSAQAELAARHATLTSELKALREQLSAQRNRSSARSADSSTDSSPGSEAPHRISSPPTAHTGSEEGTP
jgi:hypothetical protein